MYAVRKFDLSLLEEGEEYVTDITVVIASLFPLESGTDETSLAKIGKLLKNAKDNEGSFKKGRLRMGTKSLIFEPNAITYPLLKFKFSCMNALTECENSDIYKQFSSTNCLFVSLSQVTCIPTGIHNGKTRFISPYQLNKVKNQLNSFVFFIFFTNKQARTNFLVDLKNAQNGSFVHKMMDKTKFNSMAIDNSDNVELGIADTIWAWRIKKMVRQRGMLAVGNKCIYFEPCPNFSNISCKKIYLRNVIFIFKRQCSLEPNGLEVISLDEDGKKDYRCLFLELSLSHQRDAIVHHLKAIIPHVFKAQESNEFLKVMQGYWVSGRISNFHYLDFLNYIGGRSRHDLSQYPVFPWILSDYTSLKLDLSNSSSFRDLSKPIGALNQQRLNALIVRMQEFKIDNLSSFNDICHDPADYNCNGCLMRLWECGYYLYGSHYSNLAFVVHLLIRVMPECQLRLYEGNFDSWNRCFHSIGDTFFGITNEHNCFYELIPEMFQENDDFLLNNLNVETNQGRLNSVVLPPWAKGNAKLFLSLHRKALESDFVSFNLSRWIDLIFGFKQSGYRAVKSHNVFHPFTYLNNIRDRHGTSSFHGNVKTISYTKAMKALIETMEPYAVKVQVNEFGQIPLQLFTEPHPERQNFPQFNSNETFHNKPWFLYINANMDKFPELALFLSPVADLDKNERILPQIEHPKPVKSRDYGNFTRMNAGITARNATSLTHANSHYIFTHRDGSLTFFDPVGSLGSASCYNCFITPHSIVSSCNVSYQGGVVALGTSGGTIIFVSVPRFFQAKGDGDQLPTPHPNFDSGMHSISISASPDSVTSLKHLSSNHLAIGCFDESIYMLSLKGLKVSLSFDGLDGPADSIASHDNLLVGANGQKFSGKSNCSQSICLWDMRGRPSYLWKYSNSDIVQKCNQKLSVGISSNYIAVLDDSGSFFTWDLRMLSAFNYFRDDFCKFTVGNFSTLPIIYSNGIACPENSDCILFVTADSLTGTCLSKFNLSTATYETLVSVPPAESNAVLFQSQFISLADSLAAADLDTGIIYSFY